MAVVSVRVAVPLVALAGADLPSTPRYEYEPLIGDATGFYAAARELISAAAGWAGAVAVLLLALGASAALRLRPSWLAVSAGRAMAERGQLDRAKLPTDLDPR